MRRYQPRLLRDAMILFASDCAPASAPAGLPPSRLCDRSNSPDPPPTPLLLAIDRSRAGRNRPWRWLWVVIQRCREITRESGLKRQFLRLTFSPFPELNDILSSRPVALCSRDTTEWHPRTGRQPGMDRIPEGGDG